MIKNIFISFYRYKKGCCNINPKKMNNKKSKRILGISSVQDLGMFATKIIKNIHSL